MVTTWLPKPSTTGFTTKDYILANFATKGKTNYNLAKISPRHLFPAEHQRSASSCIARTSSPGVDATALKVWEFLSFHNIQPTRKISESKPHRSDF